jgi:hypothetical protein
MHKFSPENIERRFRMKLPHKYADASLDTLVPMVERAQDFIVVVIGGAGKHSAYIPTFGNTHAVTRALAHADGRIAGSVAEMRVR